MNDMMGTKITSMEVAQMVDKQHKELLRDIRKYCEQLNESKIAPVDFFSESTYVDSKGETRPCFLVTKKGCEFIAHKLTGQKGTEFTARYNEPAARRDPRGGDCQLPEGDGQGGSPAGKCAS